jgi:GxxExxY protein
VIYKRELTRRLRNAGIEVCLEAKMTLVHDGFAKDYFMDILVDRSIPVEAKVVEKIGPPHRAQTMNYLFIGELPHATLVNFRPPSVEHEMISTRHTLASRRRFVWRKRCDGSFGKRTQEFEDRMKALLTDWGGLLETQAYREAMIHFMGGLEQVCHKVEIWSHGESLGGQPMNLIEDDIAFSLTSLTRDQSMLKNHLQRLLAQTRLRGILWVNMNKLDISSEMLTRA